MKIMQICPSIDNWTRGGEKFCIQLSKELSAAGHQLLLVTGQSGITIDEPSFSSVHYIPQDKIKWRRKLLSDYFNYAAASKLSEILANEKPDIVHFHNVYGLSSSLVKLAAKRFPTLVTLHDMWSVYYDGTMLQRSYFNLTNHPWKLPLALLHRKINHFLFSGATLVSPSIWLKNFVSEYSRGTEVDHIPNAISPIIQEKTKDNMILWVGKLSSEKGLQRIIPELSRLSKQYGWMVRIVGDGPQKQTFEKQYPNIQFVGHTDPTPYYRQASVQIVSSICYENFPTVVLEGMSHGVALLGHAIGGIQEIILDGKTGLLYSSSNEFGEKLEALLGSPELRKTLSMSAQTTVKLFDWDHCVSRYSDLYVRLTNHDS